MYYISSSLQRRERCLVQIYMIKGIYMATIIILYDMLTIITLSVACNYWIGCCRECTKFIYDITLLI